MYSLLLRKALPFALTFILGSLVGGLFRSSGFGGRGDYEARSFRHSHGGGHSCRMRFQRRNLVAESKPLNIINVPDASVSAGPNSLRRGTGVRVMALATFGADGKVRGVESGNYVSACGRYKGEEVSAEFLEAVRDAASRIKFEPETVDGVPVTVTRETEIIVMLN